MKKEEKAIWEIYRRAYREAEPPADFDKLYAAGLTQKEGWFNDYSLPMEKLKQIFDEVCKEYKINKHEKSRMSVEVYLGGMPKNK